MPQEVLTEAASEMLDWHGSGMGVMEMSHRGKEFISIYEQAQADLRELLAVPSDFKILFMQGGGEAGGGAESMALRGYVLGRLFWNPDQPVWPLVDEFLGAYPGRSEKLCDRRAASGSGHEEYGA